MEGESGVSRGIIEDFHSLDIHAWSVTGSITDELHSSDIQSD